MRPGVSSCNRWIQLLAFTPLFLSATPSLGAAPLALLSPAASDTVSITAPEVVAATPGNAKTPAVACLPDGSVHIAWHDFSLDPASLYYAVSGDGGWRAEPLALLAGKSIRPALVADGERLHLLWESYQTSTAEIYHAVLEHGDWSPAQPVAEGSLISAAKGGDGRLHAVFFQNRYPVHYIFDGSSWVAGGAIAVSEPYINSFRLKVLGVSGGLRLALATSAGDEGYDIRLFDWTASAGWGRERTLYRSSGLSSDDVGGAVDSRGVPRWTWTEQDPNDVYAFGIVTMAEADAAPVWVARRTGYAMSPELAFLPDDREVVAWTTPEGSVAASVAPHAGELAVSSGAGDMPRMATDAGGTVHVVYYGSDESGVQQIWHAEVRAGS
ncbi:MAG: hypothetical protein HYV63_18950 [Candidatus Schekmanbacteria bacterium]|nr:hypothetical protein [Candidatus Schekmanbacteria bacterium]